MSMHVVIPDNDPLIPLLEKRAIRRGLQEANKGRLRKRLPKLARNLISERLSDLEEHGDPLALNGESHAAPK